MIFVLFLAGERKWKPGQCLPCMYCSDTLISFKKYKHHLKKRHSASKIPPVYACPKCRFITLFEMQFEEHAQMHGRKDVHACSVCDYLTPKVEQMTKHLRYNCRIKGDASIVARRCSECRFVAWSSKTFDEHRATHLVRDSSKTSPSKKLCSEKDSSQPESSAAMPAKADQGKAKWRIGHKYYCKLSKQCGHASSSQLDHKNHVKKKHPGEVPRKLTPCNICYFVSDGVAAAEKHRVLHADSNSISALPVLVWQPMLTFTTHLRYCPSQKS
ncbi:hypothetical protein EB796_017954 [Bugula neritina]|uniref:C2H2-type domain-containing protein n=1 Tax=Bugula neritina TaxID=10212 RepID=A0A7J7JBV3_BUGNE|nr:hypothetical protein EB796_017954 [Bugula neritina]